MNLQLKSWHTILYKNTYQGLPDSLCPYFWKLLIAMLLLPITWGGYVIPNIRYTKSIFLNFMTTVCFYTIGYIIYNISLSIYPEQEGIWEMLLGITVATGYIVGVTVAISAIFILIYLASTYISDTTKSVMYKRRLTNEDKPKKTYILIEWYKAFKGKYCPKINWS